MELLDEVAVATAVIMPGYVNREKRTKQTSSDEEEDMRSYDSVVMEEEKDMAECLILLANGGGGKKKIKLGYKCKTCDKPFPSFQVLGGHRAVHMKSNPETETMIPSCNDDDVFYSSSNSLISLQLSAPSITTTIKDKNNGVLPAKSLSKVHQCSICGSEFYSGQALGGHMRRHMTVRIPVRSTGDYAPVSSMESGGMDHQCSAGLDGHLGLAVAVMYEMSLGEQSPWAGYLQLLPEKKKACRWFGLLMRSISCFVERNCVK